jgi:NADH-quinone oxidoreductase subunit L
MEINAPILLVCIAGFPLLAALVGYALRRRQELVAYICLATLLLAAVSAAVLLVRVDSAPHVARLGVLPFPALGAERVYQSVPHDQFVQLAQGAEQYFRENPAARFQAVPLQLSAGRSQLLFALSTALIAALCLLFALWERRGDPNRGRFFATLTLFSSAMLLFLTADTLLLIYIAWELMGLCSFLLIGHAGTAPARRSAREAFWTTRVTDFGLLFAVIIMMGQFNWTTLSSASVNSLLIELVKAQQADPSFDALGIAATQIYPWLGAVAILVLVATLGKLAMFPLSFWLPGAMVAPTPVSALLHAATMVAAGPFLLTRLGGFFQYSEAAMVTAVLLGGVSLVLCGLMALSARDAKQVLAYSTISQLAVAVVGVGVLNYNGALYHVLAHAWFKAPLFLAVGYLAVLASQQRGGTQHLADHSGTEQHDDHTLLTRLAGSAHGKPIVLATLVLAGASLAGVIGLGGYFGKESILLSLLTRWKEAFGEGATFGSVYPLAGAAWTIGSVLLILSIPITAAYSARLVGLLGWGHKAADAEAPRTTGAPQLANMLALLAALIGSVGAGLLLKPFLALLTQPDEAWRWGGEGVAEQLIAGIDVLLVLGGIGFAWLLNVARPASGAQAVESGLAGPIAFFASGMRLREFWLAVIGRGGAWLAALSGRGEERLDELVLRTGADGRRLARASAWFDEHAVDGARWWGAELWWVIRRWHQRWLQNGSIQHYMWVILLSAAALCFIVLPALARAFKEILGRA